MKNWIDIKTAIILFSIVGTAFVAYHRLGVIEDGQKSYGIKIADVETDIQDLKLRIVEIENSVEVNAGKLEDREEFMGEVSKELKSHGDLLLRHGIIVEQQSEILEKILKKLE